MQLVLSLDTPSSVQKVFKRLMAATASLNRATQSRNELAQRLKNAAALQSTRAEELAQAELDYVIGCCVALEILLAKEGKGWCPLCRQLVAFETFGFAVVTTTRHIPAHMTGYEYSRGEVAAYDELTNYYFRVPHESNHRLVTAEQLNEAYSRGSSRDKFYGTIVKAPPELFSSYGIAPFDPELLERANPHLVTFIQALQEK